MKNRINLGFFVSTVACAMILNALSVWDLKFALHKAAPLLQGDVRFRDAITEKCASLASPNAGYGEKYFLERLPIPARDTDRGECTLLLQSAHTSRLRLRDYWNLQLQVRDSDGVPVADRHYAVDFPRPLVLLPFVVLILAMIFEFRWWGIRSTLLTYIFLASGANLIAAFRHVGISARTALTEDFSWAGMLLILFWVALCRGRRMPRTPETKTSTEGKWLNRALLGFIGLWNPAVFSLGGRLLLPFRGSVDRIAPFFGVQVVAVCLSVYLLTLGTDGVRVFFASSLWMPRYFTFSALLFLFLQNPRPRREPMAWALPGFWRTLLFVGIAEAIPFYSGTWESTPNLIRVGLALVLGQLVWPFQIEFKRVFSDFALWTGALLTGALLTALSTQLSVTDLVLLALNPVHHPTGTAFFTFLCGLGLGFVSGNFAVAFFTLFMAMTKAGTIPLIHAALLDGTVAGILLSPVSVINLIPAAQFGLTVRSVVAYRFRQLAFPLAIGFLIYAVSSIGSVAILRPATFVFLCLVAVVIHLRKGSWKFGSYTISLSSHNASH